MHKNKVNLVVSDQTYLYDFSYQKRVDLIANYYFNNEDFKILVFGFEDRIKHKTISENTLDFTVSSINKTLSFFISTIKCAKYIKNSSGNILVENFFSSLPLVFLKNKDFHLDLHGDVVDEFRMLKNPPSLLLWILRGYEFIILCKAISISVCSLNHKKSILYKLAKNSLYKNIEVLPNITSGNLNDFSPDYCDEKFELFINGFNCIVYSGSAVTWQNPEKMLNFFQAISDYNSMYRLLILTKDVDIFINMLLPFDKYLRDKIFVTQCEYKFVNYYYSKSVFGLIFRDYSRTNFVSSPTKLMEYAKNGLRILYTGHIGDFLDQNYNNEMLIDCNLQDIKDINDKMMKALLTENVFYNFPYELNIND